MDYRIEQFGGGPALQARELAGLHAALLPRSPVVKLGRGFMERFYYKLLPEQGYVFGALAWVEGKPGGFVSCTDDSDGFMSAAMRRHLFRLGWVLATSIAAAPARIAALWETWRIMNARDPGRSPEQAAEILSIGVLPEYRDAGFKQRTGLHVARDLMLHAMERFKGRGARIVRLVVDADNTAAQRFYERLGWRLARRDVPGWHTPSYEYVWIPAKSPGTEE